MGTWYPGRCPGLWTCWAFSPRRAADKAFPHYLHLLNISILNTLPFRAIAAKVAGFARAGPLVIGMWTYWGLFSRRQTKTAGRRGRPAVNIRMYQELLYDNLLAVYDVKTVLSLCNATTAEVINNTVLLCRFDDFCIVDAIGECTSRNQTP